MNSTVLNAAVNKAVWTTSTSCHQPSRKSLVFKAVTASSIHARQQRHVKLTGLIVASRGADRPTDLAKAVMVRLNSPAPLEITMAPAPAPHARTALSRGVILRAAFLSIALPLTSLAGPHRPAVAAEQQMRTSADFNSLQELTGQQSQNLGAGTISSRSRPQTGIILLDEVQATGSESSPTVTAELVLDGGVAATATFNSAWPLSRGMYYDVEARSKNADGVFLQVVPMGSDKSLANLPNSYFTEAIFSTEGRYGAYGSPTDVKVLKSESNGKKRLLEISFKALSPSQAEVPRKAIVAALQPEGSEDVLMLVGGSTASRWKNSEADLRKAVDSFKVVQTRPTKLRRVRASDYRFEQQGGLWEQKGSSTEVF